MAQHSWTDPSSMSLYNKVGGGCQALVPALRVLARQDVGENLQTLGLK
jgi:hypothetical protein